MAIKVLNDKCRGCKLCIPSCPFGVIEIIDNKAVIKDGCTMCGTCVKTCKFKAIEITRDVKITIDKSLYKGVWVLYFSPTGEIHRPWNHQVES